MKLNAIQLLAALLMCLFNNNFAMDDLSSEKQEDKIHGIILKAEIPNEKTLCFVPSHHFSPLSKFTQEFQNEVFKHSQLILESYSNSVEYVSSILELTVSNPLSHLVSYASKDCIASIGGFVQAPQEEWSLDLYPVVKCKFESTFENIANMAKEMNQDLPHFRNIYMMKPGVVFALFSEIDNMLRAVPTTTTNTSEKLITSFVRGMDGHIAGIFGGHNKPITGVETMLDVINSLSLRTKTLDDIIDDVIDGYDDGVYPKTLEKVHSLLLKSVGKKSLMDVPSLAIRNKSWMTKYEGILVDSQDCIAVHGYLHFPGEDGLLNLGQQQGWKWSIFQVNGNYLPFIYDPQGNTPFLYEK